MSRSLPEGLINPKLFLFQTGRPFAVKKEAPGNALLRTSLLHEVSLHRAVQAAFDKYDGAIQSNICVPLVHSVIDATDDQFWQLHLNMFPTGYRERTTLVQMDRILPLPKVIRKALIAQFYPSQGSPINPQTLDTLLNNRENKHCLVRTYLGRENGVINQQRFSLRNFPLYLGSMKRLGLDVAGLANSMGKAYALMHWGAGVNGDDVEFVLGTSETGGPGDQDIDFQHRAVGFYLLDFGQCDLVDLSQDPDDVYQAFKGAMVTGDNQLFIPHYKKNPEGFAAFREGYKQAGQTILAEKNLGMKFSMENFMREYEEYAEDFL